MWHVLTIWEKFTVCFPKNFQNIMKPQKFSMVLKGSGLWLGNTKIIFLTVSVMVYIHGGSFTSGTGSTGRYGPERFLDYGVVSSLASTFTYLMFMCLPVSKCNV